MTGELDEKTLHEMKKARCGNPDVIIGGNRDKRYATLGKWYKTDLKFYQEYGNDMSHADQQRIINRAFKYWSDVAPRLTFTRTNERTQADFWIRSVSWLFSYITVRNFQYDALILLVIFLCLYKVYFRLREHFDYC